MNHQSLKTKFTLALLLFALTSYLACSPPLSPEVEESFATLPEKVDYNFHVKPILSDRCYTCHGPDENTRKAGLRLDVQENAFAKLPTGNRALVKYKAHQSEAFHRILSEDPEYQMPPPDSKLSLSAREKAMIIKWLEQGAEWKPHWSFIPVQRPGLPAAHPQWATVNPIDLFIQAQLPPVELRPNPPVDKERLIRRVTMDLTGLPPTLEEIDAFLENSSPQAYEQLVDHLLASDQHAERLAMEWLDVARYADSHGVSFDGYRNMWPYRDWVIEAFKKNLPYDHFITRQVAGDLLPDATGSDQIATAFYRQHPMEASEGSIEEEYRVEYVVERTATTGTAFLGLTVGCARCHDHKFDPISQKEFYQLSAFFNSVEERGMGPRDLDRAPTLLLYRNREDQIIDSLDRLIAQQELQWDRTKAEVQEIKDFIGRISTPQDVKGEIGYFPFEKIKKIKRKKKKRRPDTEDAKEEEKAEYEEVMIFDNNKNAEGMLGVSLEEGQSGNAVLFDDDYEYASIKKIDAFDHYQPFSVSLWIYPAQLEKGKLKTIIGNSSSFSAFYRGWEFALDTADQLTVRLIHRLPDELIEVVGRETVRANRWTQVGFTYDGSRKAEGIQFFIDGKKIPLTIVEDRLNRSIRPIHRFTARIDTLPLRMGKSYRQWTGDVGLYTGKMDELRLFDRQLSQLEMAALGEAREGHSPGTWVQEHQILNHPRVKEEAQKLRMLRKTRLETLDSLQEVMVMRDLPEPRPTYLLKRGLYNVYGEQVACGTPAHILAFPEDYPQNRIGLAQWLTHPDNPLPSRVLINRYWQMIFGTGIVKTTEDFGIQGDLPTHPDLLDWLAAEFMESGWKLRHMLKLMVMSHTYRQSSETDAAQLELDPENRYYARSHSYRWPAEIIRDQALAASGLLTSEIGGPSVKPYQPPGLWKELGDFTFKLAEYKPDSAANLYRRSLYTFIRRFSPHPFLINFDATNREICVTRRVTTNTPLQALNLLNDPQFVEASRVLSERIQKEKPEQLEDQLIYGYRLSTGLAPSPHILSTLEEHYQSAFTHFSQHPNLADSLLLIGEMPFDKSLDKRKTAALTIVANTLFNYDESYMKR